MPPTGGPTLLAHAEYAILDSRPQGVEISLRRLDLDRRALRSAASAMATPLGRWLDEQYT